MLARLQDALRRIGLLEAGGQRKVVRAATTGALAANTYAAGVKTADANGALGNIDDVVLAVGDRLLIQDEVDTTEDGIYVILSLGSAGTPFILRRADDAFASEHYTGGMRVFVDKGTVNGNGTFELTNDNPIVLDTTTQVWVQVNETTLGTSLASVANGAGASLVGIEDAATLVTAADVEAALVELGVYRRQTTIGHADLTTAGNDTAEVENLGAALPTGAYIVGAVVHLVTPFSGGGIATLNLLVGGTDADAIISALDLLGAAGYYDVTAGVKPTGNYSGQQMTATFDPDAAHNVLALTAGSVTITLWFKVAG